jgi:hypothetical protein
MPTGGRLLAPRMLGIGFYASAGQAREAGALLSNMPEHILAEVLDAVRPALDMRSESVGLCRLPPCTVSGREPVALQPRCERVLGAVETRSLPTRKEQRVMFAGLLSRRASIPSWSCARASLHGAARVLRSAAFLGRLAVELWQVEVERG